MSAEHRPRRARRIEPRLGATYRVQLQPSFGFADAAAMVPDLARLGIETVYTSPVTEAIPGSTHGYDGTDPTRLRAELGGEQGFELLLGALAEQQLGLCIDVVPNHLAADVRNPWWREVLEHGRDGELGELFDIDWDAGPTDARGKVSLPLLDGSLEEAIASGLLEVRRGAAAGGGSVLALGELELPLAGPAEPGEDVSEVLARQHYRLIDWHDPHRDYRRFFDIDGLVGVRVDDEEVFQRTHTLLFELGAAGSLSAIRVDHLDGLRDPGAYLRRLEERAGLPIVIEKILTGDEHLRTSWPVAGTTGYEVLDDLGGALVDPEGLDQLVASARSEGDADAGTAVREARHLVANRLFGAELSRAAAALGVDAEQLIESTTHLPVYRTYLDGGPVHPDDEAAIDVATRERLAVRNALLGAAHLPAVLRYQQLTGAVMAKGVEDTAWYRLAGPLAFCEVGGDPGRDRHDAVARLHERAARRAAEGRGGLVPWTTHDTKRGGDVRARLYALSELANAFERGLDLLRAQLSELVGALASPRQDWRFETRVLAQLALATIPAEGRDDELGARVGAALVKGAREAKARTSWIEPDESYEATLTDLAERALAFDAALVRQCFGELVLETARLGAASSLSGAVLRTALPGVPDCYQGDESWNLVLVDPDNRRPPDPVQLRKELERIGLAGVEPGAAPEASEGLAGSLRRVWADGRVKVHVTASCLRARSSMPAAFAPSAGYVALDPAGAAAASVLACCRNGADGSMAVAVTTRLAGRLVADPADLPCGPSYAETVVDLPGGASRRFVDALSGRVIETEGRLDASEVLAVLPVALLLSQP